MDLYRLKGSLDARPADRSRGPLPTPSGLASSEPSPPSNPRPSTVGADDADAQPRDDAGQLALLFQASGQLPISEEAAA